MLLLLGVSICFVGCSNPNQEDSVSSVQSKKAVFDLNPGEVGKFVAQLQREVPDLSQRVTTIARNNLKQPYKIGLLGEFPFQTHDADPLFAFNSGDCVVFVEHVYAMALASDWETFFSLLQRIRYKDGEISLLTRNHYILADWNHNNSWLVRDVTKEVGGKLVTVTEEIDRQEFFRRNYGMQVDISFQKYTTEYIPSAAIKDVISQLREADCVNVIRRKEDGSEFCGHVGIISKSPDGNICFINSTQPAAVEEPLLEYVQRQIEKNVEWEAKGRDLFVGMKFLRLQDDPLAKLAELVDADAPLATGPRGLLRKAVARRKP